MVYRLLPADLPDRLRKAGLVVLIVGENWRTNGRPASKGEFKPVGVLNHHTGDFDGAGDAAQDLIYAKWLFWTGRSDLPAPLCGVSISAEGVVYLGAGGRTNHAGAAKASGSVAAGDGNALYVGVEWMLSGTQPIPPKMYHAGVVLNAVLLDVLGSSVQALSCHYQTSITGKWDIGDPQGISFKGHKVLNVPKFRDEVRQHRVATRKHRESTLVTFQHTSMQFSDSDRQMAVDAGRIFCRGSDVLTGTEAGGKRAKPLPDLLRDAAEENGYQFHIGRGNWVAVSQDLIESGWATGYEPVIESHEGAGQHTDRGIVWATFATKDLGMMTVGCGHYLTNGRKPRDPNYELNRKYGAAIGEWARARGRGSALVFYGGDQNMVDRTEDTFFGSPLTSAWDELQKWENTGHGNIDVFASYDADGRVRAKSIRALTDAEYHLNTDHFLVEAEYLVGHVRGGD